MYILEPSSAEKRQEENIRKIWEVQMQIGFTSSKSCSITGGKDYSQEFC